VTALATAFAAAKQDFRLVDFLCDECLRSEHLHRWWAAQQLAALDNAHVPADGAASGGQQQGVAALHGTPSAPEGLGAAAAAEQPGAGGAVEGVTQQATAAVHGAALAYSRADDGTPKGGRGTLLPDTVWVERRGACQQGGGI
jgi:hypothetical protein